MRFDIQNELSLNQAFTTVAVSTNSYEKQSAAQDLSIGRRMSIIAEITTAAGAGTSVLFEAIQADDAALTSNVTSLNSVTKLAAALPKGAEVEIPFPEGSMSQKYLGLRVTCSGGTATVSVSAYIVPADEIPFYKPFPKVVDALV